MPDETIAIRHASEPVAELRHALDTASTVDRSTVQRLHERLVASAHREELIDVAYRIIETPVGSLLLAATDAGLVRVAYGCEDHDAVLQRLADIVSPRVMHAPRQLEVVAREIGDYFDGRRDSFDLPLDLRLSAGFRREILVELQQVEFGRTASYAQLAAAAGHPTAVRAVGTACATNPLPIVVPCHRIVRSDGAVGNYVGGTPAKVALLRLEAEAAAG